MFRASKPPGGEAGRRRERAPAGGSAKELPAGNRSLCSRDMDWQKPAALLVVLLTAGLFLWARWAPRRLDTHRGRGGCGCPGAGGTGGSVGLVVRGRRGERPRVEFR